MHLNSLILYLFNNLTDTALLLPLTWLREYSEGNPVLGLYWLDDGLDHERWLELN